MVIYSIEEMRDLKPVKPEWAKFLVVYPTENTTGNAKDTNNPTLNRKNTDMSSLSTWRDEHNPLSTAPILIASESSFVANRTKKKNTLENVRTVFTAHLNKLSASNFEKLTKELEDALSLAPSLKALEEAISCVFEKALVNVSFQHLFGRLCCRLAKGEWCLDLIKVQKVKGGFVYSIEGSESKVFRHKKDAEVEGNRHVSFRRLLLLKCQNSFETSPSLSLISFIGHLYREGLLPIAIIKICFNHLGKTYTDTKNGETLVNICGLLKTTGYILDEKDASLLESYLKKLEEISKSGIKSRERFMCLDVLEKKNWTR